MFGILRYLLIQAVVINHLVSPDHYFNRTYFSAYAVFAYFLLSGFLIAKVLHEKYGHTVKGTLKFWKRRLIRIYPTYIVVALLSIIVLLIIPVDFTAHYNESFRLPESVSEWLPNIFIIGLAGWGEVMPSRLVHPAWFLSVILVLYLLAPVLFKNKKITSIWLMISFLYVAIVLSLRVGFYYKYVFYLAGSFPFTVGAIIYWYFDEIKYYFRPSSLYFTAPLFVLFGFFSEQVLTFFIKGHSWWHDLRYTASYISIVLSAPVIIGLAQVNIKKIKNWVKKLDKILGGMSYAIFLSHVALGAPFAWLLYNSETPDNYNLYLVSFIFINIVSLLIYWLVDRRLEKTR
ncbi:MAG: acyltransferase [Patescibacteria group bacterium]